MGAANTGFGAGGRNIVKTLLRSQNVPFTFLSMPADIICLSRKVVNLSKRIFSSVRHGRVGIGVIL
jgi:hypothetical protein